MNDQELTEDNAKQEDQRQEWDAQAVQGLRYDLGMSQQEFARKLGIRQQTVSEWETGLHMPRGTSRRVLSMVAEEAAVYRVNEVHEPGGTPPAKRRGRKPRGSA